MDAFQRHERSHSNLALSNDNRTLRVVRRAPMNFAFGQRAIESSQGSSCWWEIKIGQGHDIILIGIVDDTMKDLNYYFSNGDSFKTGDTLMLSADFTARVISLAIKGQPRRPVVQRIKLGPVYHLGVYFKSDGSDTGKGDSVTLLRSGFLNDEEKVRLQSEAEEQESAPDPNALIMTQMSDFINYQPDQRHGSNSSAKQANRRRRYSALELLKRKRLTKIDEAEIDESDDKIALRKARREIQAKDAQIHGLNQELQRVRRASTGQLGKLQHCQGVLAQLQREMANQKNQLFQDLREAQIENSMMKQQMQQTDLLQWVRLDRSDWERWGSDEVFIFIMGCVHDLLQWVRLNRLRYHIKQFIFSMSYTGQALLLMCPATLCRMGITDICAQRKIMDKIQALMRENPPNGDADSKTDE